MVSRLDGEATEISSSSDYQAVPRADSWHSSDRELPVPRAVVDYFGMARGLSIFVAFQVPSDTGLGSSTASGVALIRALESIKGQSRGPNEVANLACELEIERLGRPIGKQDPFTSAWGGLNFLEFSTDGVTVTPIELSPDLWHALESRLMLFYTGRRQDSARIWSEQWKNTLRNRSTAIDALHAIKEAAVQLHRDLERGEIDAVGTCLHESWLAKRQLASGVTDPWVDQWYESARRAGAKGGKLAGAGGGGFMLFYCEPGRQAGVVEALEAAGLTRVAFKFESRGASVLFDELAVTAPSFVATNA